MGTVIAIFAGVVGLIGLVGFLVIKSYTKRKASSWTGVVVDKKVIEASNRRSSQGDLDSYFVIFKTSSGEKVSLNVSYNLYSQFKVGDKAEKKAGESNPTKV